MSSEPTPRAGAGGGRGRPRARCGPPGPASTSTRRTGRHGHAEWPDQGRAQDNSVLGPLDEGQNGSGFGSLSARDCPKAPAGKVTHPARRTTPSARRAFPAGQPPHASGLPRVRCECTARGAVRRPDHAECAPCRVKVRCASSPPRSRLNRFGLVPPRPAPPARAAAPPAGPDRCRAPPAPRRAACPRRARRCAHHRGGGGRARRAPGAVPARRWLPGRLGPRVPRAADPPEPGDRRPGARAGLPPRPRAPLSGRGRGRPRSVPRSSERGTSGTTHRGRRRFRGRRPGDGAAAAAARGGRGAPRLGGADLAMAGPECSSPVLTRTPQRRDARPVVAAECGHAYGGPGRAPRTCARSRPTSPGSRRCTWSRAGSSCWWTTPTASSSGPAPPASRSPTAAPTACGTTSRCWPACARPTGARRARRRAARRLHAHTRTPGPPLEATVIVAGEMGIRVILKGFPETESTRFPISLYHGWGSCGIPPLG